MVSQWKRKFYKCRFIFLILFFLQWNTTPPPINIHPLHYCHHHHQLNHSTKYYYQYSSVFIIVTTIIRWIIQPSITISTVQYLLLSPPSSAESFNQVLLSVQFSIYYCHHHHQLNHSTKYYYQYSSVFITVTTIISWIIQPSITISIVQYLLLSPPSSAE